MYTHFSEILDFPILNGFFLFLGEELWKGENGAGDENRTHVTSLEGWSYTIELRPR